MSIRENRRNLIEQIRSCAIEHGRKPEEITLLGVSKKQPVSQILEAFASGQMFFGENYLQEAKLKQEQIQSPKVRWHFIGHVQSNKAKDLVGRFDLIHSVDRYKVAEMISKRAADLEITQSILIEINVAGEMSKSGMSVEQCLEDFEAVSKLSHLKVEGLMCFPPMDDDFTRQRAYFAIARKLKHTIEERFNYPLRHLSMGTTLDFKAAIAEGSTLVRVGTALFGPRE